LCRSRREIHTCTLLQRENAFFFILFYNISYRNDSGSKRGDKRRLRNARPTRFVPIPNSDSIRVFVIFKYRYYTSLHYQTVLASHIRSAYAWVKIKVFIIFYMTWEKVVKTLSCVKSQRLGWRYRSYYNICMNLS
jgi:hypothetical protein